MRRGKAGPPRPCSCGMQPRVVTDGVDYFLVQCPRVSCKEGPARMNRDEAIKAWNDQ